MNLLETSLLALFYFACVFISVTKTQEDDAQGIVTDEVFMKFEVDGQPIGEVVIGLFGFVVPRTVENFKTFASGKHGHHYKGSPIHRVIKGFIIQGGDFLNYDGSGTTSSFGTRYFDDENFLLKHAGPGMLGMPNIGKHTNSHQFYVTIDKTPWLDDRHVVFGKVLKGMKVIQMISDLEHDDHDKPLLEVTISDSSLTEIDTPYAVSLAKWND